MARKGNRNRNFAEKQRQKAKGQQQLSSRERRRLEERQARKEAKKTKKAKSGKVQATKAQRISEKQAAAEAWKYIIGDKLRIDRNIQLGKMHLRMMGKESRRIAMSSTRQAWIGTGSREQRVRAIYDAYSDIIESKYGGSISDFFDAKIAEHKEEIEAAYIRDRETLEGLGWSDDELSRLSNANNQDEIYKLLRDMGYYD